MAVRGATFGRYQVIKHLASGGMAEVLLARASGIQDFERYVVIKRIHRERADDDQAIKMFIDEARLAATLHHANIVQVHDIGQEGSEYFFAMEYIHGEDLRTLLTRLADAQEMIPLQHVISIMTATAAALHYAHEVRGPDRQPLGLVHRDVSPANVLVGYDGTVKVVDFGIAKAALSTSDTQSGTLKGKISYMSPEQCTGQTVDRRSDVFALGVVLYELVCVRRLFKTSSDFLTMTAIVAGNVPKPSTHRADIPPELDAIVMKALATSVDNRYQSANEMRLDLERFAANHGLRGSTTELADYMRSVFGTRPEPWLTDGEPEMNTSVDFDGAAHGLALGLPPGERMGTPAPGSLLARAHRKTMQQLAAAPMMAPVAASVAPPGLPRPDRDGSGSGTPMAWQTTPPQRRRWPAIALGAGATLTIAAVAFFAWPGGGSESSSSSPASQPSRPTAMPARPPQPEPLPQPEPSAPPATDPTPQEPPVVATPEPPPPSPEASQPSATPAKGKRVAKPTAKVTKKKADPKSDKWDPTSLLPE